jgi:prephenate dehydrogenase
MTSPNSGSEAQPGHEPPTAQQPERRAQVVGLGLVGTSVGFALRAHGWRVRGRDLDRTREARASELGALDAVGEDPDAVLAVVATPVSSIPAEATALLDADRTGRLVVTDVGGVKGQILTAITHPRFVGGHPMAGSEREGPDGADPELFAGATWVLTPTEHTDPEAFSLVQSTVSELGADVVALSPERHDELVAMVSHVPHLTAATLMGLAAEAADTQAGLLRLAAGGFRDMTRIAAGSPAIWPDICRENADAIVPVLDGLMARLAEVRRIVAEGDRDRLVALLDHAQLARRNLPARTARPSQVTELHVPVPDRPGVIAEVATVAGELGVNIWDIEIQHAPDRPQGIMLLTVASEAAEPIRTALAARGYFTPGAIEPARPVIAIDGPAGAGKSTVAGAVAERLGLERLDTGAMYRAVTLAVLRAEVDPEDAGACAAIASALRLRVGERVLMDDADVTDEIRSPEVTAAVSVVSAHRAVRSELVRRQRQWVAAHGGGVVEGRDIGSVVLPDATLRVFLTADPAERARRRALEIGAGTVGFEATERALKRRDELDSTREVSPLVPPDGAIVVDSTGRSVEEVVEEVLAHL